MCDVLLHTVAHGAEAGIDRCQWTAVELAVAHGHAQLATAMQPQCSHTQCPMSLNTLELVAIWSSRV